MDAPHRCSCAHEHPDVLRLAPAPSRRASRLQHWISEQCHLAVTDLGLELEPLFSAATYIPVAQRTQVSEPGVHHRKTGSAGSANTTSTSTSSSSSSPSKKRASSDALVTRDRDGWYWRTSTSSASSSEESSLLASYALPTIPAPLPATTIISSAHDEDDMDARSDSPLLGFASDSDDEQDAPQQFLQVHPLSNSVDDFPHTPGPEDMDAAFLVLSPPVSPSPQSDKVKERLSSPRRDKLRYPAKGYRRDLPSGLEDDIQPTLVHMQTQPKKSSQYRCSLHAEHTREDQVTTPTPHHVSSSPNTHQPRSAGPPSSSSSPSLIQSSPSLFPASSLSSFPSVTSLSSLHSRPSISSLHSLSEMQHTQPLRPALSRKPSLARKPSFPLLKEVKEEDGEFVAGPMSPVPDLVGEEEVERARTVSGEDLVSRSSTDETVMAQSSLLPSAIISTSVTSTGPISRTRSHSASTATSKITLAPSSGHAYSYSYSSITTSVAHAPFPTPTLVPQPTRTSIGLGIGPGATVRTQLRSRSNSSVNDVNVPYAGVPILPNGPGAPSRASVGLGLGPGVGVRTQTRSRSNSSSAGITDGGSHYSIYSTYSIVGLPTPPRESRASGFLGAYTPPGTAGSAVSGPGVSMPSTPGTGAGARHAVYIVDSEEVSRRLGELLQSGLGDEEEEDEDEESRRRTVMVLDGAREMGDPVLPRQDYFSMSRAPSVGLGADWRPSTPPMSAVNHLNSATVNVTPTRRVPYPSPIRLSPPFQGHVSSASFASAVNVPPPNTPAGGGFGCLYASPYASSSQIYLGPSGGQHSRGSSRESKGEEQRRHSPSQQKKKKSTGNDTPSLLPASPILTKADLERRLGPPPKRPPPAPPLDLGLELELRSRFAEGYRFPAPPSPSAVANGRRTMFEEEELDDSREYVGEEDVELRKEDDVVDEAEMEALRREMGLEMEEREGEDVREALGLRVNLERASLEEDETIKGRPPLSLVVPRVQGGRDVGYGKEGMQSRWSVASSMILKDLEPIGGVNIGLGKSVVVNGEDMDVDAMGLMGVSAGGLIGSGAKRWKRRSREPSAKESKGSKAKSAPASPITRKEKVEKRKSLVRGEGLAAEVHQTQGGKRSRLASFFSKLAGSGSVTPSSATSAETSSPQLPPRTSTNSTSEPDLRVVSGAWETMPLEEVPPVPPVPPMHTLPRMMSKSSMTSLSKVASTGGMTAASSRRGTMMSQAFWDDEDYGSVPPTPSSFMTGFVVGNSPRGSGMSLRTSRSVSNLNLAGMGRVASSGLLSPTSEVFPSVNGPDDQDRGVDVVEGSERTSESSLPPPPVPPKDYAVGSTTYAAGYEWPSVPLFTTNTMSSNGHITRPVSPVVPQLAPVKAGEERARDRMMVRLRLKSSPSLGNLKGQQGQSKLRSLAARMMGREHGSGSGEV